MKLKFHANKLNNFNRSTYDSRIRFHYKPLFAIGCAGQRGKAPLTCTDGRLLDLDWLATSCTTGEGIGRDQDGASFAFTFGLNEKDALIRLAELKN